MATAVRKLENDDIRAIFESLHDNKPPQPGLDFKIVPVDSDGLRLSPPAHEYEDGIYVLLRPDKSQTKKKKKKGGTNERDERPKIPPHLAHLEMKTPLSKNCTWSLSGPQFPKPTAIQQRYCYPQGNIEYASKKGGSMWTMYNREGKEDDEYRLLHVYYSVKRANNISSTSMKARKVTLKSSKDKKKKNLPHKKMSTAVRKATITQKRPVRKPTRRAVLPRSSPRPPSSAANKKNQIFRQPHRNISPNTASTSGCIDRSLSKQGSFGVTFEGHMIHSVPSSLYNIEYSAFLSSKANPHSPSENHFPQVRTYQEIRSQPPPDLARDFDTMLGVPLADPSSMMKEPNSEWSTLMGANDSNDFPLSECHEDEKYPEILLQKLKTVHKNIIHKWIDSRPRSERGRLVSVVANWAQSVSQSPLEILVSSEGETEKLELGAHLEDWDMAIEV